MEMNLAKQMFTGLVRGKVKGGVKFILAVYDLHREYQERAIKNADFQVACQRGCAVCCCQLITCTKFEWDAILEFILGLEKNVRVAMLAKLNRIADQWKKYMDRMGERLHQDQAQVIADWWGKPCPFLSAEQECTIYPVRIIDCRTLLSTAKCRDLNTKDTKRFPFDCDWWANNMILDEMKVRGFIQAASSLHHWIYLTRNNNWQPLDDQYFRSRRKSGLYVQPRNY